MAVARRKSGNFPLTQQRLRSAIKQSLRESTCWIKRRLEPTGHNKRTADAWKLHPPRCGCRGLLLQVRNSNASACQRRPPDAVSAIEHLRISKLKPSRVTAPIVENLLRCCARDVR